MAKVVLLNSGGLDSAILAKYLHQQGLTVWSLHVETDMLAAAKMKVAAATTAANYCDNHKVLPFKFGIVPNYWESLVSRDGMTAADKAFYPTDPPIRLYGSVTNPSPTTRPFREFHSFPNQAMVICSIGVAYAKFVGATEVYTGNRLTLDDKYLEGYNEMANASTRAVSRPSLEAPFGAAISYAKAAEILNGGPLTTAQANALRAEFAYTYSCRWGTPCGICLKCTERAALGL